MLLGLGGKDTLNGGLSDAPLKGGAGNGTFVVGNLGDGVNEGAGGGGGDVVQTSLACYLLGNNVENLTYTGSSFTGTYNPLTNTNTNTITGRAGNDSLAALDGDDIFVLGAGFSADLVFGFDAASAGGQDRMDISAMSIRQRPLPPI